MISNSMKISLEGDYKINDIILKGNSNFNVSISGGKICIDNKLYDSGVMLTPLNSSNTIILSVGPRKYKYFGKMSFKISGSYLLPINTVDVESYLKGVVGYEMSDSYPIEALKAQAVSARGYAIANIDKHKKDGFDICDTTDCQVYKGYNSTYKNVIKSVDDTKGQVLYYVDDIVCAYFAASNGGYTEASQNVWSSSLPYLITKKDDFDNEPWPYGDKAMTSLEVQTMLIQKGYLPKGSKFLKIDIDNIKRYESSRIACINVIYQSPSGETKTKSFLKDASRYFLSLPSSMYTVTYDQALDTYNFSGRGYGHGVGMSQIGARNRAKAGQTYDQILKFYYDGTVIKGFEGEVNNNNNNSSSNNSNNGNIAISIPSKISSIVLNQSQMESAETLNAYVTLDNISLNKLYKFVVQKNSKNVFSVNYGEKASFSYVPKDSGEYNLIVYMKDKTSNKDYDDMKSISFNVRNKPKIKKLTASKTSIYENTSINVVSEILSDLNRNTLMKYEVILNNKVVIKTDYTISKSNIPVQFGTSGNYIIKFYIKDEQSKREYDDSTNINIKVLKKPVSSKPPVSQSIPSIIQTPVNINSNNISIKKGMKGNDVKAVQQLLYKLGYYNGNINSVFDSKTFNSVKSFQKANKLPQTGIVDNNTMAKIKAMVKAKENKSKTSPSIIPKVSINF